MIRLTKKQREAVGQIKRGRHILLHGGARSGKTVVALDVINFRAVRYAGSRHLVARHRFNHAKISLWLDSIPRALLAREIPREAYEFNGSDFFVEFSNGSQVWVDGLDSEDRVEKILGREYATAYLNEISQISYAASVVARTRLSQSIPGMRNFALYDCNPPPKSHWAYKLWFMGIDPETGEALKNPEAYKAILINPYDNALNLPAGYIEEELENLPEAKRRRFLLGEWADAVEGLIFRQAIGRPAEIGEWDVVEAIPSRVMKGAPKSEGLDYGFSVDPSALVFAALAGDDLYIDEVLYSAGLTNASLAQIIKEEGIPVEDDSGAILYHPAASWEIKGDSAEPKSNAELRGFGLDVRSAIKGPDSIRKGIDWLLGKRLHLTRRSSNIMNELTEYRWASNRDGRLLPVPVDEWNHGMDAIRYACSDWARGSGGEAYSLL